MTAPMDIKDAAKVLRRHNEWRRGADDNHWQQSPYSPAELGHAIDAAVAALEGMASAVPVVSVAVSVAVDAANIAAKGQYQAAIHHLNKYAHPSYGSPQPAYCCAKCELPEMRNW